MQVSKKRDADDEGTSDSQPRKAAKLSVPKRSKKAKNNTAFPFLELPGDYNPPP